MPLRITGMSSGMDTEKIVADLMRVERIPVDRLKQQKIKTTWTMDAYREINSKLAGLRAKLNDMRYSSDWKLSKASSSDETSVTVSASGTANPASHTILVNELAKAAAKSSSAGLSNSGLTAENTVQSLTISDTNNQMNVTLNGIKKTITLTNQTYADDNALASELKTQLDAAFGSNKVAVSVVSNKLTFTPQGTTDATGDYRPQFTLEEVSGKTGVANLGFNMAATSKPSYKINKDSTIAELAASNKFKTALSSTSGSFTINGQGFSFTSSDTISSILNKVNSSNAGVYMSYDEISDKVMISSKDTGSAAKVQLTDEAAGFLKSLGLTSGLTMEETAGSDADVTIDGVRSFRASNSFSLDGVTYTINKKTTSAVNVNITRDLDSMVTKIKDFVTSYNETLELMNKRVKEPVYRGYPPLTDEQKQDMKESDIKLWEEKAQSGMLHNDTTIKKVVSSIRELTSQKVEGVSSESNVFVQIGIETLPYNSKLPNEAGKLVIDETKLRAALSKDPDSVIAMFSNQQIAPESETPEEKKVRLSKTGIAQRMYDEITSSIDQLVDRAGGVGSAMLDRSTDLGEKLFNLENKITDKNNRLIKIEDYYYKKFAAMEKAISNSNSQLAMLSKQFG